MSKKEALSQDSRLYKLFTWSISINILLVILKIYAGYISNSRVILADGLHTFSDIITTVAVMLSLIVAKKPRDLKHPYGHERIETIITFLLSIVLLYTGCKIGLEAVLSMINGGSKIRIDIISFIAVGASILLKELQYQITIREGRRINSDALIADAWHHRSDALSSIAALLGIMGVLLGFIWLDSVMALMVSLIVAKIAIEIFIKSFNELMDVSMNKVQLEELIESILELREIENINDIRTRKHGSLYCIDLRACVNPNMMICKGHELTEEIEAIIRSNIDGVKDIIIHLDPCPQYTRGSKLKCGANCSNHKLIL